MKYISPYLGGRTHLSNCILGCCMARSLWLKIPRTQRCTVKTQKPSKKRLPWGGNQPLIGTSGFDPQLCNDELFREKKGGIKKPMEQQQKKNLCPESAVPNLHSPIETIRSQRQTKTVQPPANQRTTLKFCETLQETVEYPSMNCRKTTKQQKAPRPASTPRKP